MKRHYSTIGHYTLILGPHDLKLSIMDAEVLFNVVNSVFFFKHVDIHKFFFHSMFCMHIQKFFV